MVSTTIEVGDYEVHSPSSRCVSKGLSFHLSLVKISEFFRKFDLTLIYKVKRVMRTFVKLFIYKKKDHFSKDVEHYKIKNITFQNTT